MKISITVRTAMLTVVVMAVLSGCTKTLTYSFRVSTGSSIDVTLTTDTNYTLMQNDGSVVISQNDKVIIIGDWYQRSLYEAATNTLDEQGMYEQELDGYPCWYFVDTDTNSSACIVLLDVNTCLLLESESLSLENLEDTMQLLTFKVQNKGE